MAGGFLANLTSGDVDAAERFLVDWYGPATTDRTRTAAPNDDLQLPGAVRRLYELASRWPQAVVQNQLVEPPRSIDGRLVFYVENQAVYQWAAEAGGDDDAVVWGRETGVREWAEEEAPLSAFVLQLLVLEAIISYTHGATVAWLPSERLPDVIRPLELLPHGSWRWPDYPTTFYAGEGGQLAFAGRNRTPDEHDEHFSVVVAARDTDAVAYLDEIVDDSWEHFSRRDRV